MGPFLQGNDNRKAKGKGIEILCLLLSLGVGYDRTFPLKQPETTGPNIYRLSKNTLSSFSLTLSGDAMFCIMFEITSDGVTLCTAIIASRRA